jgi:hypothetical protein
MRGEAQFAIVVAWIAVIWALLRFDEAQVIAVVTAPFRLVVFVVKAALHRPWPIAIGVFLGAAFVLSSSRPNARDVVLMAATFGGWA